MTIIDKQAVDAFDIAIIVSRFHGEITEKLLAGAEQRLQELGFSMDEITIIHVPGAIEIPITAQRLAQTKKFVAIICLGAVIFGETRHFDYVCQQVSQGCQQVSLTHDLPVIFGVLTTDNLAQAEARSGGPKGHVGRQSVDAAVDLVSVLRQI
jgi:6,7-dimethyl-8-ribityllumazine synthase